ncbi:Chemotaxis protein CheA [Candidatus Arcanobacter lacustris]|uniref:Chemotaxis protein CheA n=1 Tax=Candidatus Arcanibacter lacustris TaxID=1607817 RepID=A0A0F5MMT3_9RICK|nr:Chemotaxis protein CheA [Candidatus Arcanobacter lacustris]
MDELIKDFLVEASEAIQKLDTELVILERDPKNQDLLGSIFRIMHTIKGTCGFLGLSRLESLAHAGENILGKIRDHEIEVTPTTISLILESLDVIKVIVAHLEAHGSEPPENDVELIKKLNLAAGMEGDGHGDAHAEAPALPDSHPVVEQLSVVAPVEVVPEVLETKPEAVSNNVAVAKTEEVAHDPKKDAVDIGLQATQNKEVTADVKATASSQSVRVSLDILEGLMLMVSELVLTRNQLQQIARSQKDSEFSAPIQRLGHITSELQERVMKTRMQPISNAWTPFPRLVRGLANELGKKIELKMVGEDTELDRQLIETIKDPLTHMVRNSCDHGLEMPEERTKAGKSDTGIIMLKAYHQGGHIIIEISDNGKGLDVNRIKTKVLAENLATEEELAGMSDIQICQFIFKAGFSTAAKITSVSGRGVGMDVVKTNIEKINGTIELSTKLGKGTSFFIKIPLTLAIMSVLIVQCKDEKFAIPQINVLELVRTGKNSGYMIENINERPVLRLRNTILSLEYLSKILGFNDDNELDVDAISDIVICEIGGSIFGIVVDKVYDTEEIVVKPVAPILKPIEIYSGITLLGDGSIVMILDPNGIFRWVSNNNEVQDSSAKDEVKDPSKDQKMTKFLLVKSGKKSLKAIPIELVSRLEEIDVNTIEYSGTSKIVQYRDKLMYLTQLDDDLEVQTQFQHVISFVDRDKILGIMVDDISDIVEHRVDIVSNISTPGYIGTMIINDKTTDLVDLSYYFESVFGKIESTDEIDSVEDRKLPRMLMVDDSLFFRKIIPQNLLIHGYDLVATENADRALEILEKDANFVAMIVDYNMPGMNGMEFASICEKDPRLKHIPIIVLSSALGDNFKVVKSNNIKAYISKTNHDQLLRAITELNVPGANFVKFEGV